MSMNPRQGSGSVLGIIIAAALIAFSGFSPVPTSLTYRFASLASANISADDAPVTKSSVQQTCEKAKQAAAAQGHGDTGTVIEDKDARAFQDSCVAAILNPARGATLNPADPQSYICVGRSAKVNVNGDGLITDTSKPNPSLPAGTCAAVACSSYTDGESSCFAAKSMTQLNGSEVNNGLGVGGDANVSADTDITHFTMDQSGTVSGGGTNGAETLNDVFGGSESAAPQTGSSALDPSTENGLKDFASGLDSTPSAGNAADVVAETDAGPQTFTLNSNVSTDVVTPDAGPETFASNDAAPEAPPTSGESTFSSNSLSQDTVSENTASPTQEGPVRRFEQSVAAHVSGWFYDIQSYFGFGQPSNGLIENVGVRG